MGNSTQKKLFELIHVGQQLCYPTCFQRVQNCLSGQPQSVLMINPIFSQKSDFLDVVERNPIFPQNRISLIGEKSDFSKKSDFLDVVDE